MKKVTEKKILKVVDMIEKLVDSGSSFIYAKFISCQKIGIPQKCKELQTNEAYITTKTRIIAEKRNQKRFIKVRQ